MDAVEEIGRAQVTELVDEDGDPVVLEFAPGLSSEEIELLGAEVGVELPRELRDLAAFAAGLDESFLFVDLRSPEIGMGFSWGRFGPRTVIRRHGHERLFAYARPERSPACSAACSASAPSGNPRHHPGGLKPRQAVSSVAPIAPLLALPASLPGTPCDSPEAGVHSLKGH